MSSDLRSFISLLDQKGYLYRFEDRVEWKYEIGNVARNSRFPLLFENISDYPGHKLFTNGLGSYKLIAIALHLDEHTPFKELVKAIKQRIVKPFKPVLIDNGPVKENIISSKDVDLFRFPVPWWSKIDAGRYIGTWHLNITNDPDTGLRNVGVYRMQILDANQTTVSISSRSNLSTHIYNAEKKGQALEMAVAIGVDEAVLMSAASALPYGSDEYFMAGGLAQKPVKLVKCSTIDVEVPANSEIVIEGKIRPGTRVQDGPYLDYAGIPSVNYKAHLFEVTAIMHRNNPIFRGTAVGEPGAEDHIVYSILSRLNLTDYHGSRIRQKVQNYLLKKRYFKAFQLTGRVGKFMRKTKF